MSRALDYDFLVIGSGIAGLSFALRVADRGRVAIVTKKGRADSATNQAQGGIAAVTDPDDSFEAHVADTLEAGAGLCKESVVRFVVEHGPEAIQSLVEIGVGFDREPGARGWDRGREGGHTRRRVLHASDFTGKEIERALLARVEAHPQIDLQVNRLAVDLVTTAKLGIPGPPRVAGAYVLDAASGVVEALRASIVMLATGGCGKVYLYTSNPDVASGDGLAMAWRAGASVANLEFIQFHPTCLYHPAARSFLVSEAVRGEGAVLRTQAGVAFMANHDPRADLAPRDIVARAIDMELKRSGEDCVFLDATGLDPGFTRQRFPNIYRRCLEYGFDMTKQPLPVVPAAHYSCGGVRTDLCGETDLRNLFAAGEVACSGLHGANRLASNSLLEGVVFARAAADEALARMRSGVEPPPELPPWDPMDTEDPAEAILVTAHWDEIRRFMWNYVGIVRSDKRLERARRRIALLRAEIEQYYWDFRLTPDLVELRNLAEVADLIIRCARLRRESRGLHYTLDHPGYSPGVARDSVLIR
ncbi:MAG: L-aspartate oxidase [Myxococcota bacterium]